MEICEEAAALCEEVSCTPNAPYCSGDLLLTPTASLCNPATGECVESTDSETCPFGCDEGECLPDDNLLPLGRVNLSAKLTLPLKTRTWDRGACLPPVKHSGAVEVYFSLTGNNPEGLEVYAMHQPSRASPVDPTHGGFTWTNSAQSLRGRLERDTEARIFTRRIIITHYESTVSRGNGHCGATYTFDGQRSLLLK